VVVLGFLIAMSALDLLLAYHNQDLINIATIGQPPGGEHLLGTDLIGRDLCSRLLFGGRVSLVVGSLSLSISIAGGAAANFYRGPVDKVMMRVTDVVLYFPNYIFLISLVAPGVLVSGP
jgi:peptide/nickel transport system permease protein